MNMNKAIIGAILGDIAGSEFEMGRSLFPDKEVLFSKWCNFTDDTIMSLAVKMALDENIDFAKAMRILGKRYSKCGYSRKFYECNGFESFMRILISLDGDNDTLGAIGGPVVYSYYGGAGFDPEPILRHFLTDDLLDILNK